MRSGTPPGRPRSGRGRVRGPAAGRYAPRVTRLPDHLPILGIAADARVRESGLRRARDHGARRPLRRARAAESGGRRLRAAPAGARQPVRALAAQEALELLELDRPGLRLLGDARRHRPGVVLRLHAHRLPRRRALGRRVVRAARPLRAARAGRGERRLRGRRYRLRQSRSTAPTSRCASAAAPATAPRSPPTSRCAGPRGHESLNVVVPWSATRFQCNSKHAALPCEGEVRAGERRYALEPRTCFGGAGLGPRHLAVSLVLELGRRDGLRGRRAARRQRRREVDDGHRRRTRTGSSANGRLHKIMEDLRWEYDPVEWRKPWRVVAPSTRARSTSCSSRSPRTRRASTSACSRRAASAPSAAGAGACASEGREIAVDGLVGWAEEFAHRW